MIIDCIPYLCRLYLCLKLELRKNINFEYVLKIFNFEIFRDQ